MTQTARALAAAVTFASLAAASPLSATDGNIYPGVNPVATTGAQATASLLAGGAYRIDLPAANPSLLGRKWSVVWGCPAPGMEAASVYFGALRLNGVSALSVGVTADDVAVWEVPDAQLPQSPAEGKQYAVGVPGGHCAVGVQLRQSMQVAQHARTYWIDRPAAYFRDLTAPSVGLQALSGGWLNAATGSIAVSWTATDNMGADGIRQQRVVVGGIAKWSGEPGQGAFGVGVDLAGVPDGAQAVQVVADGDGTAAGSAQGTVLIDRMPPVASVPTVTAAASAAQATFSWSASDGASGVAGAQVEVNAAVDGSATGQWLTVGGEIAGGGPATVTAPVSGIANGLHAVRVRVRDVAGNVSYSPLAALVLDTTPPTVTITPPPAGPVRRLDLGVHLDDNLAALIGLSLTSVDVNAAPDGSASGTWMRLATLALAPGAGTVPLDFAGLIDGTHALRVRTANGGDHPELVGEATVVVGVDQTSPTLTDVSFSRPGPDMLDVAWIATDARAGVATARLEWRDGAVWRTVASRPVGAGAGQMSVDIAALPSGVHGVRLVVGDGAGNESAASGPIGGVAVDHTPPAITGVRLVAGSPWSLAWTVVDGDVGQCAVTIAVNGAGTAGAWREIARLSASTGARTAALPVEGLTAGAYRVQLRVCDAVGNTTTVEVGGLTVGSPSTLSEARSTLAIAGVRARKVGGRSTTTATLTFGRRLVLTGRLTDVTARPLSRHPIVVRGTGGVAIGSAVTGANGRFQLRVRPIRGGAVTVAAVAGGHDVPTDQLSAVRVRVRPSATLRASTRKAVALGAPVVFSGVAGPAPSLLARTAPKTVVLEWRDPARGWRPVLNGTLGQDGAYRFEWRFQTPGQRAVMRVRLPAELGWGLETGQSAPVTVTVR